MSTPSPLALFAEAVHAETLRLMEELAAFLARERGSALSRLSPAMRCVLTRETSRMTRDLMDIMAWLLMEKAVAAGEVDAGDAARRDPFRLRPASGPQAPPWELQDLPIAVRGLIDRCRRVHARALEVERLTRGQRAAQTPI